MASPVKKRILVGDDETGLTDFVREALVRTGRYEVYTENNGLRAFAVAKECRPDLVLLDVIMPETEGSRIAAEMRAEASLKTVPIVFLTAIITKEEQASETNSSLGGYPFLAKPVSVEELLRCVETNLRKT